MADARTAKPPNDDIKTVKLPNDDIYVGQIANNKPHGSGFFLAASGPCVCLQTLGSAREQ
jgi:hypothetical protein